MILSVVTVTWNSAKYIAEQIKSVDLACAGLDYEQIVVDNASGDNTVEVIENNFPHVKIIKSDCNLGFAGGYNLGIKNARGEFFLYLNPDMKMIGSIAPLIDYLKNNVDVGIVSGKLVTEDGKINLVAAPRRFPRWWEVLAIFVKIPHLFPSILNKYSYRNKDWYQIHEVDSVRGSFMLVRRDLVDRLGYVFDPRYFLWWEDVDLCREAKRLGYRVVYNPIVSCVDHVGRSFSKRNLIKKQWMFFTSAIKYFRKWGIKN